MRRFAAVGGFSFKAGDPEKLYQWYETSLGIN